MNTSIAVANRRDGNVSRMNAVNLRAPRPPFSHLQRELALFNRRRLAPGLGDVALTRLLHAETSWRLIEAEFVEAARAKVAPMLTAIPQSPVGFIDWFQRLKESGPGQGDPLFEWLATAATREDLRWFLEQELALEAGFDDLVALAQVKMPVRAKLEMARNYWDEMGRGREDGMHGPMLSRLAEFFGVTGDVDKVVPEALALGNMMTALAVNRRYAFHAVGALGVIEMTAPERAAAVARGLDRLGVPARQRHYFALHAVLDVKHSEAWNEEVLIPLVAEDGRRARAIAEGALLRLQCGAECFARYRMHFGLKDIPSA